VARALNANGVNVVLPSYSLCPVVSVMDIVAELRGCLAAVWERTRTYPLVVGHSAGGHLTAAMLATDWSRVAGVPGDLVRAGIAISGIFDLRPLIATSVNNALRLDRETARTASPRFWSAPPGGRTFVAAVGANESSEFLRQSRDMAEHWGHDGMRAAYVEIPDANHFTAVDELTPNGALFGRVLTLARQIHGL
jgi:arylformamidase